MVSEAILQSLEAIFDKHLQKVIEGMDFGDMFRTPSYEGPGYVIKLKILLDPKYTTSEVVRNCFAIFDG